MLCARRSAHFLVIIPVISSFRLCWDTFGFVSLTYLSIMVPLLIVFEWSSVFWWFWAVAVPIDVYFMFDVFYRFVCASVGAIAIGFLCIGT